MDGCNYFKDISDVYKKKEKLGKNKKLYDLHKIFPEYWVEIYGDYNHG